jgi:hypothetical protein
MDGDGDIDIASVSWAQGRIVWHKNDGSQNFTSHEISNLQSQPHAVHLTDMDGDGDLDVLAASYVGALSWYENLDFTPPTGDFDRDGTVTGPDYELWDRTYGSTSDLRADGSGDSATNAADYVVWRKFLGATAHPSAPPAMPGDYNVDSTVDAADYVVWRKTEGSFVPAYSGADGSGNTAVNRDDLGVWTVNFGTTLSTPSPGATYWEAVADESKGGADGIIEPILASHPAAFDAYFGETFPSAADLGLRHRAARRQSNLRSTIAAQEPTRVVLQSVVGYLERRNAAPLDDVTVDGLCEPDDDVIEAVNGVFEHVGGSGWRRALFGA